MKLVGVTLLAYSLNALLATGATWSQVIFEASLAVESFLLLNESNVRQRTPALAHGAHEVARTPSQAQSSHELATVYIG